jgi:hypothetical protein
MTADLDPVVEDLVEAATDLVVSLRSNEGVDEALYDRLVGMLRDVRMHGATVLTSRGKRSMRSLTCKPLPSRPLMRIDLWNGT